MYRCVYNLRSRLLILWHFASERGKGSPGDDNFLAIVLMLGFLPWRDLTQTCVRQGWWSFFLPHSYIRITHLNCAWLDELADSRVSHWLSRGIRVLVFWRCILLAFVRIVRNFFPEIWNFIACYSSGSDTSDFSSCEEVIIGWLFIRNHLYTQIVLLFLWISNEWPMKYSMIRIKIKENKYLKSKTKFSLIVYKKICEIDFQGISVYFLTFFRNMTNSLIL